MTHEDEDGQMDAEQRLKERVRVLEAELAALKAVVAKIVEERENERGEL